MTSNKCCHVNLQKCNIIIMGFISFSTFTISTFFSQEQNDLDMFLTGFEKCTIKLCTLTKTKWEDLVEYLTHSVVWR